MARKKKKKSGFQKLTIVMAWLMAFITLAAVIAGAVGAMASAGNVLKKTRKNFPCLFYLYSISIQIN